MRIALHVTKRQSEAEKRSLLIANCQFTHLDPIIFLDDSLSCSSSLSTAGNGVWFIEGDRVIVVVAVVVVVVHKIVAAARRIIAVCMVPCCVLNSVLRRARE